MSPDVRKRPPPDTGSRSQEESSTRIEHSVPPPITVWGVIEVDLGAHVDPHGWITDVPHGCLPCPPAGSLVRLFIGGARHVSPVILYQFAGLMSPGCRVEVCGSRDSAVADTVTQLRAALTRSLPVPGLGDLG